MPEASAGDALAEGRGAALTGGKAASWRAEMVPRRVFRAILDQIRAHSGERLGWQMRQH